MVFSKTKKASGEPNNIIKLPFYKSIYSSNAIKNIAEIKKLPQASGCSSCNKNNSIIYK